MYDAKGFAKSSKEFLKILKNVRDISEKDIEARKVINNATYTIQQSIGAALDGLKVGKSNTARKLNGDFFERFIRLILQATGVNAVSGVVQVPVIVDGQEQFKMNYQHDLIVRREGKLK